MASTRGIKGYFDFSKGVVTEGSKLTYVENSLADSLNMSFSPGNPLAKRLGMSVTAGFDEYTAALDESRANEHVGTWYWESPGGDVDLSTLVVGVDNTVIGLDPNGALEERFKISLDSVLQEAFGAPPGQVYFITESMDFSAVSNKLYVVCYGRHARGTKESRVVSIEFVKLAYQGFVEPVASVLSILYRDFGDASTLSLNQEMPITRRGDDPDWFGDPSLPQYGQRGAIEYDLFNRGWIWVTSGRWQRQFTIQDSREPTTTGGNIGPAPWYRDRLAEWPSKGDTFVLGITTDFRSFNDLPRTNEVWDVDAYRTQSGNAGSAATGHVILSAYDPQRWQSYVSLTGAPNDTEYKDSCPNPEPDIFTSIAVWYGRVCFGTTSGKVYMSQLYKDSRNDIAGKCYQEQDPTARDFNELLATDGTVIDIGGAGAVLGMAPLGNSLVVITNQGVWQIQGSAESYDIQAIAVSKLLSDYCSEKNSIISFPGGVAFYAESSIYVVQRDPTVGTLSPTSVTDTSIKSLYTSSYAEGVSCAAFDYKNKRVEWIYADGRILQFDVRTGGFYPQKIEGSENSLVFAHRTPRTYFVPQTDNLVSYDPIDDETDNLVSDADNLVVASTTIAESPDTGLVYYKVDVIFVDNTTIVDITRSSMVDENMVDYDIEQYRAYAEVGYDTFQDPTANKEVDTLFAWFEITEDGVTETVDGFFLENQSVCDLSVKWEWTTSGTSNRWYNIGNIYRLPVEYVIDENDITLDLGYSVAQATTGITGAGKSIVFRFDDAPGKHMRILGWAVAAANEVNP